MMRLVLGLLAFPLMLAAADKLTDIEFARPGGYLLTMDVSIPEGLGPHPAIILVHGGGWENGDKETYIKPWFDTFTKSQFAWFSINYRLAPQFPYPAAVEDVEAAVRFIKANHIKFRIDETKVALVGESAGGHLVALAGARGKVKVKAVVDFYGPNDLIRLIEYRKQVSKNMAQFLGVTELNDTTRKKIEEASPATYISKRMPPYFFIHGDKDTTVPLEQSQMMCEKMKAAGAKCDILVVPGAGHGVESWEKNPALLSYKDEMTLWLGRSLK